MSEPSASRSLTTECPTCGALVQAGARFCPDCGRRMTGDSAAGGAADDRRFEQPFAGQLWDQGGDDSWANAALPGDDYGRQGFPQDPQNNDSRNGVLFVAAALILVVGLLIGSVLWILSRAGAVDAAGPTPTPTVATSGAGSPSSATSPTPTPTPSASASPSASESGLPPVTGQQSNCPQTGGTDGAWTHSVSGNPGTSCEFSEAVRAAFLGTGGTASASLSVTSPVTNQAYPMNCDLQGSVVTCRGTENASIEVLLYP